MKKAVGTAEHYEAPKHILCQSWYLNLVPPAKYGVLSVGLRCAIEIKQEREIKIEITTNLHKRENKENRGKYRDKQKGGEN